MNILIEEGSIAVGTIIEDIIMDLIMDLIMGLIMDLIMATMDHLVTMDPMAMKCILDLDLVGHMDMGMDHIPGDATRWDR